MNLERLDDHTVAVLKRLLAETDTAQVLRLVADLARQHAEDLLKQGSGAAAARFARQARMLARASDTLAFSDVGARAEAGEEGPAC